MFARQLPRPFKLAAKKTPSLKQLKLLKLRTSVIEFVSEKNGIKFYTTLFLQPQETAIAAKKVLGSLRLCFWEDQEKKNLILVI